MYYILSLKKRECVFSNKKGEKYNISISPGKRVYIFKQKKEKYNIGISRRNRKRVYFTLK